MPMNEKTLSRLCKLIFENDLQTIKQNLEDNESIRVRPRFFYQVGHETMFASSGNKYFSLNPVIVRPTKIMNRGDKNWAQF